MSMEHSASNLLKAINWKFGPCYPAELMPLKTNQNYY